MTYVITLLALAIALLYLGIAGGFLDTRTFMTVLRLKLLLAGHRLRRGWRAVGMNLIFPIFMLGAVALTAELQAVHLRPDPLGKVMVERWVFDDLATDTGHYELVPHKVVKDYGTVSRRVVTNAGVAALANAFLNTFEPEIFNYHASGTGGTAEAATDTALVTEVETRVAGTQSSPAGGQYRTVATVSYTATRTITEHGVLSATTAGTLWDRSLFTGIPVVSGDSIQFTYTVTFTAGG